MKVYISRKAHFNAAHRVYNPAWTDAKNAEVFGKCANPYMHGHNFELEVTLCGTPNPDTGFVYDLKKLKEIIELHVIEKLDHKNLNEEVDFLKGKIPSTEHIAIGIWEILRTIFPEGMLYNVRLYETPRNYVDYRGE